MSGVLAAVVSGIFSGWHARPRVRRRDAPLRHRVLARADLRARGDAVRAARPAGAGAGGGARRRPLAGQAVVVALVVVAVRMAWALLPPAAAGDTVRERIAVGWAGMRGAISLAAALAVPTSVSERPEILLITFGVIAVTLLGQGLTLAARAAARCGCPGENRGRRTRPRCGSRRPRRRSTGWRSSRTRARPRSRWSGCATSTGRASRCASRRSAGRPPEDRRDARAPLRRDAARPDRRRARDAAASCARRTEVAPDVLRRVERDLDLEEARLPS